MRTALSLAGIVLPGAISGILTTLILVVLFEILPAGWDGARGVVA